MQRLQGKFKPEFGQDILKGQYIIITNTVPGNYFKMFTMQRQYQRGTFKPHGIIYLQQHVKC